MNSTEQNLSQKWFISHKFYGGVGGSRFLVLLKCVWHCEPCDFFSKQTLLSVVNRTQNIYMQMIALEPFCCFLQIEKKINKKIKRRSHLHSLHTRLTALSAAPTSSAGGWGLRLKTASRKHVYGWEQWEKNGCRQFRTALGSQRDSDRQFSISKKLILK